MSDEQAQAKSALERIVTGGQTGTDRASLDIALEYGIACGGWCPKGRLAEDGIIHSRYPLVETATAAVEERTELNARDSDGTLVLTRGPATGGTAYTIECAEKYKKPVFITDMESPASADEFNSWLSSCKIRVLNVAGPRESHAPGEIYEKSKRTLLCLFGLVPRLISPCIN